MPLLQRVILAAKKIGITEFVIVIGYQAARIRKTINAKKLGVKITWVRNLDWRRPNGISVLKAEKFINGKFFLFMSDHVFDPAILKNLKEINLGKDCGLLCVDYNLNRIPNLDDATKVRTENNRLTNVGKSVADFNAIDAGIFICTPHLFGALRQSQSNGDDTLSGGIRVLAQDGRMCSFNIGESFWQDVDTEPDAHHAEKLLLDSTRFKGDGIVAKHINRKISNKITEWLIKTPITPNQISILNFIFSIFIAWVVSFGKPLTTMIGGVLFQFASILDGCDGEVAQIKLKVSKTGALVDTLTDHLSYVVFLIGVTLGAYNATGDSTLLYVTGATCAFLLIALNFSRLYLQKKGSASLRDLDQDIASLNHSKQKVWYLKFFGYVHHCGRRDLFSFCGMAVMLFGNITVFYWGLIGTIFLICIGISISAISMLSKGGRLNLFQPFRMAFAAIGKWFGEAKIVLLKNKSSPL